MNCLNCGMEIKKGRKFCCTSCRSDYYLQQEIKENPPQYTHCQNPECRKKLVHVEHRIMKNGDTRRSYRPEKMFCGRKCYAAYQQSSMTGKPCNFQIVEEEKKERRKREKELLENFHKRAKEEINKMPDPFSMFANINPGG